MDSEMDSERPIVGFALSLLGGILVLGDGMVPMAVGSAVSVGPLAPAGAIVSALGALGFLLGVVICLLAVALYRNPESHQGYGIAILILSLVSIISGGGFILGLILGSAGGIFGIVFEESEPLPLFDREEPVRNRWQCANCGKPLYPGMTVCSYCDTPVSRGTPPRPASTGSTAVRSVPTGPN
ncbi:MAG: DUF6114 domain-containing protein [Thermoplasmata archaeon]|nr:DUF6114 domain-containing protein [Thermoplasmata archaeon]